MLLAEYIENNCINITKFARMIDISPVTLRKYMRGKPPRIDIARKICKATDGKVTFEEIGLIAKDQ